MRPVVERDLQLRIAGLGRPGGGGGPALVVVLLLRLAVCVRGRRLGLLLVMRLRRGGGRVRQVCNCDEKLHVLSFTRAAPVACFSTCSRSCSTRNHRACGSRTYRRAVTGCATRSTERGSGSSATTRPAASCS